MRITVYQKTMRSFLCLIVFSILISLMFFPPLSAQDEQPLVIEIYLSTDWNESVGTTVYEGERYDITVSPLNGTEIDVPFLDVNITVLGVSYNTNMDLPYVEIIAPSFNETQIFTITATKEGYLPAAIDVIVMKGRLSAVCHPTTVEEKKNFQITVTDQNHTPIENALLYITADSEPVTTDQGGSASLTAPAVSADTSMIIQVIKNGYQSANVTIRVHHTTGFVFILSSAVLLQFLPLLGAVLVVILAIVIVSWRKKRSRVGLEPQTHIRQQDQPSIAISEKQNRRPNPESAVFSVNGKRNISISSSDSRVEEIRIPAQEKKKETTILAEEKEPPKPVVNQKKQQDEYFKGQEYMRYKLDEMTGKIDKNTDGKWFEGERDIKYKVDEALKKNVKKKKDDEENEK